MEKYKQRVHGCVQYTSLRILEEMSFGTIDVEVNCMFDEL